MRIPLVPLYPTLKPISRHFDAIGSIGDTRDKTQVRWDKMPAGRDKRKWAGIRRQWARIAMAIDHTYCVVFMSFRSVAIFGPSLMLASLRCVVL